MEGQDYQRLPLLQQMSGAAGKGHGSWLGGQAPLWAAVTLWLVGHGVLALGWLWSM